MSQPLDELIVAKYSMHGIDSTQNNSLTVLQGIPTGISLHSATAATIDCHFDDNASHSPQPHPSLSPTMEETNSSTSLLPLPSAVNNSFDYQSKLSKINQMDNNGHCLHWSTKAISSSLATHPSHLQIYPPTTHLLTTSHNLKQTRQQSKGWSNAGCCPSNWSTQVPSKPPLPTHLPPLALLASPHPPPAPKSSPLLPWLSHLNLTPITAKW